MHHMEPRKKIALLFLIFFCIPMNAAAHPANLPQAVVSARTIFIENETGFSELLYAAVLELNKWGHFDLTNDREKADLVMVLSSGTRVRAIPDGQFPRTTGLNAFTEDAIPKGHTRIALLDPKTGATLWSDLRKTEGGKVKSGHLLDGLRAAFENRENSKGRK